jgi:hypothetical protein
MQERVTRSIMRVRVGWGEQNETHPTGSTHRMGLKANPMRQLAVWIAVLVVAAAAFAAPARAGLICRTITMTHPVGEYDCESLCQTILRPERTAAWRSGWWNVARPGGSQFVSGPVSGAPREIGRPPRDIASCKATVSTVTNLVVGPCTMTICGPASVRHNPRKKPPDLDLSRYNVPARRVGPPSPGLLETDGGFARQGPSAIGTPMGGAPASTIGGSTRSAPR